MTSAFRDRQLIRRIPASEIHPGSITDPLRDSRPVADSQLQLAQLHALADEAANAMAQMREIAERMKFGRDVVSSIDEAGRALAAAMLGVAKGPAL